MDGTRMTRKAGTDLAWPLEVGPARFADLICAEPGWVRAEFDAIVAANFGSSATRPLPPRDQPPGPAPARHHRGDETSRCDPPSRAVSGDLARTARRVGARERSPPPSAMPRRPRGPSSWIAAPANAKEVVATRPYRGCPRANLPVAAGSRRWLAPHPPRGNASTASRDATYRPATASTGHGRRCEQHPPFLDHESARPATASPGAGLGVSGHHPGPPRLRRRSCGHGNRKAEWTVSKIERRGLRPPSDRN
ncbi:hypothetical protein SacmaDRAFT_0124 [Saccharomonospora marina XMU15]|uniref:Uncharacterized protein n=1 Tax=Saccharomonospora marina XMU15 TaxID=882083 RepID=H5WYC2_9PSEU|nr:hypothetical protein SacmaDRAFT_0124 [Saccharomonospora marina XMU15]